MDDRFDLARFVAAQDPIFERVRTELTRGRKTSHWMWFIFPQVRGLGVSSQSHYYGISGRAEAAAYLQHAVLGPRLLECTTLVNRIDGHSADDIFGAIDSMKFRSSMTLFAEAGGPSLFEEALEKYFEGKRDARTITLLSQTEPRRS
ncbi:MAG: DUF1810 domain-containing protein [Acidobacteriia bacterium]|nr:DUF1810 domain-containing protein [Terriglobia bacterium]